MIPIPTTNEPNMTIGTIADDGLSASSDVRGRLVAVGPGFAPWGTVPFGVMRPDLDLS